MNSECSNKRHWYYYWHYRASLRSKSKHPHEQALHAIAIELFGLLFLVLLGSEKTFFPESVSRSLDGSWQLWVGFFASYLFTVWLAVQIFGREPVRSEYTSRLENIDPKQYKFVSAALPFALIIVVAALATWLIPTMLSD